MEEMKVDQTSRLQGLIQEHQQLDQQLYQNQYQEQMYQKEISQQNQKLFELRIKKLLRQYELEQDNAIQNFEKEENNLDEQYKEKLYSLLHLINNNENETLQLTSITKSELTTNYFIFMPNTAKAKSTKLLELELIFDTQTFKIKNVQNKQNGQYLTQNEFSLTLSNLAQNYNFGSKSVFFASNLQKALFN